MATTKKADTLRSVTSFHCEVDGVPVVVHADEVVRADDPVVAGREALFVAADAPDRDAARTTRSCASGS